MQPNSTPENLVKLLGPLAAEMLCRGIDDGLFLPPLRDVQDGLPESEHIDHAAKITSEDRHVDWSVWSADEIILRDRVLGRLWDTQTYSRSSSERSSKRIAFQGPWTKLSGHSIGHADMDPTRLGQPVIIEGESTDEPTLGLRTSDGQTVIPSSATIEGERNGKGLISLINRLRD